MNSVEIKQLRKSLKMTQSQLADKIGVAKSTVSRWERGIFQPTPVIAKMLKELKGAK